MSNFNVNKVAGNGHTFGDGNRVKNNFTSPDRVLTRDDYYQILLEIWDLGQLSVDDYLDDKYEKHITKNPHFVELLYRDVYKVMDGVSRPEDGDLIFVDGDFEIENGDLKPAGHTNNFHDALTWLHFKVVEKKLDNGYHIDLRDPFGKFNKEMTDFEKHVLQGGHDSPNVTRRLKELNEQLKAERASFDTLDVDDNDMEKKRTTPKVFISYAWDDETKPWVKQFATRLRGDHVDAMIDQWSALPGDQLPHFMERAVRDNDYVLIICTPKYKEKSDNRQGGVGYEGDIMTSEVFLQSNHRKYIPILLKGTRNTSLPSWLGGKYFIDLSHGSAFEDGYKDLVTTLRNERETAPPLGERPSFLSNEVRKIAGSTEEELKN